MNIKKMLLPINEFSRCGKKLKGVKGIVLHWTASLGAPAINIKNYFGRLANQNPNDDVEDRYASAHYAVDDNEIIQVIPDDEMAYHVGSKIYSDEAKKKLGNYPNNCTIGIEMCVDKNGKITEKTFQNTVDLTVYLCKKYGLNETHLWTHKGVVLWKDCPKPWVDNPAEFERFKREVAKKLRTPSPTPSKPKTETKPDPVKTPITKEDVIKMISKYFSDVKEQWIAESADRLYEKGIVKGKGNGVLDPDQPITRGETIVLIDRLAEYILKRLDGKIKL